MKTRDAGAYIIVGFVILAVVLGIAVSLVAHASSKPSSCDLPWGLPHVTDKESIIVACHAGYASGVGTTHREARWVAYELTAQHDVGCFPRTGLSFKVDPLVPPQDQAKPSDYRGSGYDLGHMAPNEDFAWDKGEQRDTFSMINVEPQLPGLNRQGWERLEEDVRAWALSRGDLEVYVGPIFETAKGTIGADKITVPSAFFKVVVDRRTNEAAGFVMPQKAIVKGDAEPWRVPIANIESRADVTLPLPSGSREAAHAWPVDLAAWRTAHRKVCTK